jgi:GntR family transcriptional regulator/MocR family aminotransferase
MLPTMASSDGNNGNVIYRNWGSLCFQVSDRFCIAPTNLIVEAKKLLTKCWIQEILYRNKCLELIYEGEIHRLIKKNIIP